MTSAISISLLILASTMIGQYKFFVKPFLMKPLLTFAPRRAQRTTSRISSSTSPLQSSESLISFKNTQSKVFIDEVRVIHDTTALLALLEIHDFKVDIWFCTEKKIKVLFLYCKVAQYHFHKRVYLRIKKIKRNSITEVS